MTVPPKFQYYSRHVINVGVILNLLIGLKSRVRSWHFLVIRNCSGQKSIYSTGNEKKPGYKSADMALLTSWHRDGLL